MAITPRYERWRLNNQRTPMRNFFRNIESIQCRGGSNYVEAIRTRGDMAKAMKKRPVRRLVIKRGSPWG